MKSTPVVLRILDVIAVIVLGVSAYLALVFAPTEAVMGDVQRVFYFHIGTAWVALVGFVVAAFSGIAYLVTKNMKWDRFEVAAVEISTMFFLITIILGSIWARPAWNTAAFPLQAAAFWGKNREEKALHLPRFAGMPISERRS